MSKDSFERDKMEEAREALAELAIKFEQKTKFQLKVGAYNFYPMKGTIYLDGEQKACPERGLHEFLDILLKIRDRNPRAMPRSRPPRLRLDIQQSELTE